jgi:predicted nucleotidyltransferase
MEILIPELLPAPLQEVLRSFVRRLKEQLGEHLLSVLLYGGAAKNHFRAGLSDVNLLLVLDRVTLDRLDAIAGAVARGAGVARLRVMTLGETDLADSAEVFSTKFQDIQRHHKVLWGADPTRRMSISRERLERQAKREVMNLHLRLRQGYVESHARPEVLEQILKRSVTAFLLNLGVILELKTGVVSEDLGDVVRLAAGHGFSESQLRSFLELKLGKTPSGIPRDLYKAFAANVEIALGLFS